MMRPVACNGRSELIKRMPIELRACINAGADTTLVVCADVDDDKENCDQLKEEFWTTAQAAGISAEEFSQIVFAFAKDRLENWIQYLNTGSTDESVEGPRAKNRPAADAAKILAKRCLNPSPEPPLPPSLEWSCLNWKRLVTKMKKY